VEDVSKDVRFSQRVDKILGFKTRSVICVPLLNGNNCVVGVIELINKIMPPPAPTDPHFSTIETAATNSVFTEMDMAILSSIGIFTGIALENAFLHQKVRELALIDSLTGLNNRHYFNEEFHIEIERVKRYGHTVCLLMLDVDNLKAINDRHGHLTGDKVLCTMASILKSSVRESDILARFGGDEFVILMPMADKSHGLELSKRIQTLINQENEKKSMPGVKLGLSIGINASGPENIHELINTADQKLYQHKQWRRKAEEVMSDDQLRNYLWNNLSEDND
jgi:diguanylate cyclase (GGDEF)-like protein